MSVNDADIYAAMDNHLKALPVTTGFPKWDTKFNGKGYKPKVGTPYQESDLELGNPPTFPSADAAIGNGLRTRTRCFYRVWVFEPLGASGQPRSVIERAQYIKDWFWPAAKKEKVITFGTARCVVDREPMRVQTPKDDGIWLPAWVGIHFRVTDGPGT